MLSEMLDQNWLVSLFNQELGFDYRQKMKEIEAALIQVHAHTAEMPVSKGQAHVSWAKVNSVASDSPAFEAGLEKDDLIIKFGSIEATDPQPLQTLAAEIGKWQGVATKVLLYRQGKPVVTMITPTTWAGRGLLGCHLLPI